MNRSRSVRVIPVSKLAKNEQRAQSNIKIKSAEFKQEYDNIQIEKTSKSATVNCNKLKLNNNFSCQSVPSFNTIQQSLKFTSKGLRKKNNEKKKRTYKKWIICISITLVLIAIAVTVYLLIRFLPKSSPDRTMSPLNIILRWKSSGITIAGVSGVAGGNTTELNLPIDLALDSSNSMYIVDYYNNRIQKWILGQSFGTTVAGQSDGTHGNIPTHLYHPDGVCLDSNENIYVSDTGNHRVQLWMKGAINGTRVAGTGTGGSANNELNSPYGIVKDSITNKLYIADFENHRVMSYVEGASIGSIEAGGNGPGFGSTQLKYPVGIHLDLWTSSLFIANFDANNIVRWPLNATNWTLVAGNLTGAGGSTSTTLTFCTGVTLDPMGNVYVVDAGNHRIQLFLQGQIEGRTIAGVTGVTSNASIHLLTPYTVRLDNQLNLYVVDSGNNRVQMFERY